MNMVEALDIFGIDSFSDIDEKGLKRIYRQLMIQNHPDLSGDTQKAQEINEAYESIKNIYSQYKFYESFKRKEEILCIIPFVKYISLYDGGEITLGGQSNKVNLTRYNLRANRVILDINWSIQVDGCVNQFEQLLPRNDSDEYTVDCKVYTKSIKDSPFIVICCNDKSFSITFDTVNITVSFLFDNNIKLKIRIEKGEINNG